jgi:hypothetical protein
VARLNHFVGVRDPQVVEGTKLWTGLRRRVMRIKEVIWVVIILKRDKPVISYPSL